MPDFHEKILLKQLFLGFRHLICNRNRIQFSNSLSNEIFCLTNIKPSALFLL